jgi:hypothetical protein
MNITAIALCRDVLTTVISMSMEMSTRVKRKRGNTVHVSSVNHDIISLRRVSRSWKDTFDSLFRADPSDIRACVYNRCTNSIRYVMGRVKIPYDILYQCVNELSRTYANDNDNDIFKLLLDDENVEFNPRLPDSPLVRYFANFMPFNATTTQLDIYTKHSRFTSHHMSQLLDIIHHSEVKRVQCMIH